MATAFLKLTGWKLLETSIKSALDRGTIFQFYCGLNFGSTEANALHQIKTLVRRALEKRDSAGT